MDYTEYKFNLKSQRDFYYGLISDVHADSSKREEQDHDEETA